MISGKTALRIALLLIMTYACIMLQSAIINKIEVQVTQPDGKNLDLYASGDEYHNWLHDINNYTIIADAKTGYYCYAEKQGEVVTASSLVVGTGDPQEHGFIPGINISPTEYKRMRQTKFYSPAERDAPTTGTINNIVIYIRFSDETEFGEPISTYDGWFNSSTNSQKNYFLEASYNQLTVNTSFYPAPSNNYVVSWQDSNPRAYYQPYNATTNPIGYDGDTESRLREFTLLQNATNGVSSLIPSGLTIDSDGDGRVDNVVYIVRGAAGAWSSLLWPHRWSLYDRFVYINGKRVYDFNFQLQTFLASRAVGVLCHEFFHTLGAPDLYHYTDNGISPAGTWDIMQSDQNPPQHMTAFMKYKYGDWISTIPTITTDQVYTLNPLTSSTGQCYRINSQDPNQYYVVEFRKKTGTFESSIPGSGMLIYRIDTTCGNGNADGPPDELYIYRPGGTTTVNGTISSAHFSSETGRTRIDSSSNPSPFLQDGAPGDLYLIEIGSSAGTTISFRKGAPSIDFNPNPYVQGFDSTYFPPDGWLKLTEIGTYQYERVTSGTNPTCSAQSGAGMARYNSDIAPVGNSALMVSPRIICSDVTNYGYQVSFYMYRDGNLSSALDKIEIFINTTPNLEGSPTQLGTIFRYRLQQPIANTPGWYQYIFALPITAVGNYYTIFRAVSASGYNMFLDTVRIARVPLGAINPIPYHESTRVSASQILSWQSGGGDPTGYKLYLGTNNPPTNVINGVDLGNVLSYDYSADLLPSTAYFWKVVPYNAGGNANDSPVWSFSTIANHDLIAVSLRGPGYSFTGENLSFLITIQNNGTITQDNYTVRLMSSDQRTVLTSLQIYEPLALDQTVQHNLEWLPINSGSYDVYGEVILSGDESIANNVTAPNAVHVYPLSAYIPDVGDIAAAVLNNVLPLNFYWKNSVTETIYISPDLQMQAGTIAGIVYVNDFVQDLMDKQVKIWMKNTTEPNVALAWLPFDGYVLVFDGIVDFPAGVNEIFIPLDTPFVYTGANLAVRCNRPMDTEYFSSSNRFYLNTSSIAPNRSRYLYSDSITYDPIAPSGTGTLSSFIPVTAFVVENAVPMNLLTPEVEVAVNGSNLELSWELNPGYYSYKIFETDDPTVWSDLPTATVFQPTYSSAIADRKFFKVQAGSYVYAFRSNVNQLQQQNRLLYNTLNQEFLKSSVNKD